jgi:hypothetical protein
MEMEWPPSLFPLPAGENAELPGGRHVWTSLERKVEEGLVSDLIGPGSTARQEGNLSLVEITTILDFVPAAGSIS